jgi:hypothetical protein
MNKSQEIVANVRMEERYAGLSLVFSNDPEIREKVEVALEKIKKQTKMDPLSFDNSKDKTETKQSLYLEFSDEVQRESGAFFELLLKELGIEKCANDVIEK